MSSLLVPAHLLVLLLLPPLFVGVVNRTKALWAGRKGPPLLQALFDLARLTRKQPVYSGVTTPLFRLGPVVLLASTIVSSLFVPVLGGKAPASFTFDFVAVAYLWGLGRVCLMLSALDTGSSFEGMGVSREATYSALGEPVLFITIGTLLMATGHRSFDGLLGPSVRSPAGLIVNAACVVALFVSLQIEAARVPVDDPSTHLELTMIHEVMILDHSGPDLAILQYASALKMTLGAALVASLLCPLSLGWGALPMAAIRLSFMLFTAVALGCVESLVARFRLSAVPQYILSGLVAGLVALLAAAWGQGLSE